MNDEILKNIWDQLSSDGMTKSSFEEWKVNAQSPEVQQNIHSYLIEKKYTDSDLSTWLNNTGLKKKDGSVLDSSSGAGSLASQRPEPTEQDYFEGTFGDVLRGFDNVTQTGIGDFIDDMARSVASGYYQGVASEDASDLLLRGSLSTEEDIASFIESNKNRETYGASKEMQEYMKIYEENDKSFMGVVLGLLKSGLTVVPELVLSSLTSMATNTDSLVAGATALGTGAGIGAATGASAGTVALPVIGTVGGAAAGAITGAAAAVPYAFAAAGTTLEMGATFAELLTEEAEGEKLDAQKIKEILNDPEKFTSIRNKAVARGLAIGAVDAFTGRLGGKVAGRILSKTGTKKGATKAVAAAAGIEGAGGSVGEIAGSVAADQELDISDVILEGLAETPGGFRDVISTRFSSPSYKINGKKATADQIDELTETMTLDQLQKTKIDINNDYEGRATKLQNRIVKLSTEKQIRDASPDLNNETVSALTKLQVELDGLKDNKTEPAKIRKAEIKKQMSEIENVSVSDQKPPVSDAVRDYNVERFELLSDEDKVLANKIKDETKRNKFVNNITSKTVEGIRINETEAAEKALANPDSDEATLIAAKRKMEEPTAPFNAAAIADVQRSLNVNQEDITEVSETEEITYTLPEDPKEARKDFDVIDNRKGKAGLEYEFDGIAARKCEGNYYVENNKTGSLVTATTRKEAEFLAKNPKEWDYGEGESIITRTQETISEENKEAEIKTKEVNDVRNKIKQLVEKTNAPDEVVQAAKAFLKLKPNLISNRQNFVDNANLIIKGLTPTKTGPKGEVYTTEALDIVQSDSYTSNEKTIQEAEQKKIDEKAFADLTGLSPEEFTLDQMRRILYESKENNLSPEEKLKLKETKKTIIAQGLKNAFNKYAAVVDDMVNKGVDPFSKNKEKITLSENDKKILKEFLDVDISLLSEDTAIRALDSMVNFATNQSVGGMLEVASIAKGKKEAKKMEGKIEAKPLKYLLGGKTLGNIWNKYIATIPLTIENMFKSQETARNFERDSGFLGIRNGVAKGEKVSRDIFQAYYDKFIQPSNLIKSIRRGATKTMPNGKRFTDVENDTERGLFAFMRRTVDGTEIEQIEEFKRRKGLVEQSIVELRNDGQSVKADYYQNAYDKLLKDSNTIDEVDSKTDPINKEAVEWMTNEWTKARPELENVSLSIYNRTLGKDISYTPDSFITLENVTTEPALGEPLFQPENEYIYDEETGVLKPKTPSYKLPMNPEGTTNRYVNLGFDSNNSNNLRSAYADIYTAASIRQLQGFITSPSFEKIVPNKSDRDLLIDRFKFYVEAKRGIQKGQEKWLKSLNKFAGLGVSRVLGGPTQYVKQLVPFVNTAVNLVGNPMAVYEGIKLMTTNKDAVQWLDNSGVEIANRGVQSVTNLEGTDSRLETDSEGKLGRVADVINNAQNAWLKGFLVNPDRFAARSSFMAYYLDSLKKQGIDSANIDWSTHESNQEALSYATQQTARQQNTSDVDLQGKLFSGKDPVSQVARKVFFPFANFLLNQKTRMYADLGSVFSKSNTSQDKIQAGKSLTGLVAETAAFNALGLFITQSLAAIARELRGTEEDDEQLDKQLKSRIKGRAGQTFTDIVSPIPLLNPTTLEGVNSLVRTFEEDEPFQFFVNNPEGLVDRLGVLGIGLQKARAVLEMVTLGTTGEYTDRFGNKKEIDPQYKEDILAQAPIYTFYLLGLLPLEVGSIIDYNMRAYKKTKVKKQNTKTSTVKEKKEKKTKKSKLRPRFSKKDPSRFSGKRPTRFNN